jgi:hypothetical protein
MTETEGTTHTTKHKVKTPKYNLSIWYSRWKSRWLIDLEGTADGKNAEGCLTDWNVDSDGSTLKARLTDSDGDAEGLPDSNGTEDGIDHGSLNLEGKHHDGSLDLGGINQGKLEGLLDLDGTANGSFDFNGSLGFDSSQQMATLKACPTWMTQRMAYPTCVGCCC